MRFEKPWNLVPTPFEFALEVFREIQLSENHKHIYIDEWLQHNGRQLVGMFFKCLITHTYDIPVFSVLAFCRSLHS